MDKKKRRRSAVDEVLGSASPVSLKMKAQQEAARRARQEDGVEPAPQESRGFRQERDIEPKLNTPRREAVRQPVGTRRTGKPLPERGKKKQKPAKRIPVTGNEGEVWEGVCRSLSASVGAKVTFAAASRAIWAMVVDIEDDLDRHQAPQLEKPAHADAVANADFEDQLKGFILEVLQKGRLR